jgi:hypothetical protein
MEQGNREKEVAGTSEEKEKLSKAEDICTAVADVLKEKNHSGICIVLDKERMHFSYVKLGAGAALDVLDATRKQIISHLSNETKPS